ncbi:hypothetical protein ACKI1I_22345 [Streptomyces turgidiscabies]|uniref:Putative lipoprotein n=1 Tax=Streptomyces turgidiscabies (strain Car8) TaxID=698760 RepID=L7F2J8_STRT8|nr:MULTISPECIES: hypothetical protein [Streptomyces]ELP65374.1 putative lipoprotein [Streptomyces turgidiscabies Car8]MDX3495532.1 hypothetical protein [Streptomyces turgidiscabies]GAQ70220.1 hypothetical protein T45_01954 [Streptomyces turgidiscabies]
MNRSRASSRVPLAALALTLAVLASGCGDAGGLRGAGPTATAVSPARLWPDLPAASSPAWDYGEAETETVKGITAPGDDIHKVDPVAVVRAEIATHHDVYTADNSPYAGTAARMAACGRKGRTGTGETGGSGTGACPVLKAYYRDLTGDGRDDMALGFRLLPGNGTAVRVYTFQRHKLVQIMANDDAVTAVELAGRAVIIRSPSQIPGYEYRTQWTWDADQKAMLLTRDEFLRTGKPKRAHAPVASSSASTSAASSGSSSASAR